MDEPDRRWGAFLLKLAVVAFFSMFLGMVCESKRIGQNKQPSAVDTSPSSTQQEAPSP
jgi:hypothetical protein